MPIQYLKTFTTLEEQLHEEEVLYNEALRMHALSDVLQSIKEQIEKHKAELSKNHSNPRIIASNREERVSIILPNS